MNREALPAQQVIVLLANEMDADGRLNAETKARADLACEFFSSSGHVTIIPCGWDYRSDSEIPISRAIERYLVTERAIPHDAIHCELRSRDTVGDAIFARDFFERTGMPKQIVVVTTDYHVDRTQIIFEFVFDKVAQVSVVGALSSNRESKVASEADSLAAFELTFAGVMPGDFAAIQSRLLSSHPFYNGDIHPEFMDGER